MNTIPNRQVICDVLMSAAKEDRDIVVLCSDSRGSSSMTAFADRFPGQFVETGIAEQNLVSIAAGMALCGKKPFAASPACFLSTRSMEQVKVDVAYTHTNVKLIGVSGGISYGALGMTHHSAQDIAVIGSIPGMRVYLPSDIHLTKCLTEALISDQAPAYVRTGRNAVPVIYEDGRVPFTMDRAVVAHPGSDVTVIACGEMVYPSVMAAKMLVSEGISVRVLDMYCVKPLDEAAVLEAAAQTGRIVTVEEHGPIGGLGAMVAAVTAQHQPVPMRILSLPDAPVITGTSQEVFDYYGLNAQGISAKIKEVLR